MWQNKIAVLVSMCALTACATSQPHTASSTLPVLNAAPFCENDAAKISTAHATANIDECAVNSDAGFTFTIRPENTPINNSAWYGFRVDPKSADALNVTLKYEDGKHRYPPKMSYDGKNWELVPRSWVTREEGNLQKLDVKEVRIRFKLDDRPFFVSAQEIFSKDAHDAWTRKLAERPDIEMSVIGASVDGHPISMLEVKGDPANPYVMWVGRQHPPEVTGALALLPFTDTVLGDSELAKDFRDNFNILIVPNMNPDGVTVGNWRHNKNGIDLNRDWGPFTQPETQAVKSALGRFETGEDRIVFFLDFHSTWRNLLYTQADEEGATPELFTRDWLKAVDDRLDDDVYAFSREARHNSGRPISKNYMFDNFGITSITYEVGDHTDREAIAIGANVFAEEMMRLLLDAEGKS